MGACASSPVTVPDALQKASVAGTFPNKVADLPTAKEAHNQDAAAADPAAIPTGKKLDVRFTPTAEPRRMNRESDELSPLPQNYCHDSAGSVPGPPDQPGVFPGSQRMMQRHVSLWGSSTPLGQATEGLNERRMSIGANPDSRVSRISFGDGDVPMSPFESDMAAHRERQYRHSVDLSSMPAAHSLDDNSYRRERQMSRRHSISLAAPSLVHSGPNSVANDLERTNKAGIDRILRLTASVFRTDSVLLYLRDGGKIFAREDDDTFSESVRSAACRALGPPDDAICVVEDPPADPRLANEDEVRDALKFFAGAPLMAGNGYRLGSLVLCHSQPYTLDLMNRTILRNMADLMVREVWGAYEHAHSQRILQLTKVADCFSEPHLFVEVSDVQPWKILRINQAAVRVTGLQREDATSKAFWEVFEGIENSSSSKRMAVAARASHGASFNLVNMVAAERAASPEQPHPVTFTCTFRPAARDMLLEGDTKPRAISNAGRHYYFVGVRVETEEAITSALERTPFPSLVLGPMLGKGAYGRVYKGYYRGKVVAVKVCNSCNLRCNEEGVPMEASLTGKLAHPNLVRTLETGKATRDPGGPRRSPSLGGGSARGSVLLEGTPLERANSARLLEETWLLMDFCDMGPLVDAINKAWFRSCPKGPANLPIVLATAAELASGLEFLHSQGLVHGDLSSGNVLLASSPESPHGFCVKISDFGLARKMDIQSRIETKTTGTVSYMPPEVLSEGIVSKAADVYAFGVLLWEVMCGVRAWDGLTPPQIMLSVACHHKTLELPNWVHPELARLCHECMDAEPKKRPTFEEIVRRLQKLREKLMRTDSMDLQHFRALSCP